MYKETSLISFTQNMSPFTFMHLADAFIQSDLQYIQVIHVFIQVIQVIHVSMCVPWESNPQPLRC